MNFRHPPIFCLGLPRAGTSSLAAALRVLGWNAVHKYVRLQGVPEERSPRASDVMALADEAGLDPMAHLAAVGVNAVLDAPYVWSRFPQIHRDHPDARWIFCYRPAADWGRSRSRHATRHPGAWGANYDAARDAQEHADWVRRVRARFAGDPAYLEMRICEGEGWPRLCQFLGVPEPEVEFPCLNGSTNLKESQKSDSHPLTVSLPRYRVPKSSEGNPIKQVLR